MPRTESLNPEQIEAVEALGEVFVSAGAGTGKTRVLIERYARAIERGLTPDRILAITFTDRAAGEIVDRLRERFEHDAPELAAALDGAFVSTIHGFCQRLLRRHGLLVGLDPAFRVGSDAETGLARGEAYDRALHAAVAEDATVVDLAASYRPDRLRELVLDAMRAMREAGGSLHFAEPPAHDLAAARAAVLTEARALLELGGDSDADRRGQDQALRAIAVVDATDDPAFLADAKELKAGRGTRFSAYHAALADLEQAARAALERRYTVQIDALARRTDAAYREAKLAASMLDYDDLQIETRRLLREHDDVRELLREQFAEIMVDEFQDTNRLQVELIDLIRHPEANLFRVGDARQSIYAFRGADESVFREHAAAAATTPEVAYIPLQRNYRSNPEILATVNHVFAALFPDGYEPLVSRDEADTLPTVDPPNDPAVEVFIVPQDGMDIAAARQVEARAIARRVRALVDDGFEPSDIVLLFAVGTAAHTYERALAAEGLPTVGETGRRYFAAQSVRDVLAYLRLLRNRYDDVALLTVLASPLIGVSNDTLARMRAAVGPRGRLFGAFEGSLPADLPADERRRLLAFRQRYDRLVQRASSLTLARLVDAIVAEHDFDLALLRQPDGAPRLANVNKLVRLARDWQDFRGHDLEGFLGAVAVRELAGGREPDAPAADEATGAVRLLTIHAAKGLEFPVVIVPDGGRAAIGARGDLLVARGDGGVGIKVPTAQGELVSTAGYQAVSDASKRGSSDERLRLAYVALTRAEQRLIVSGALKDTDLDAGRTPFAQIVRALGGGVGDGDLEIPGARVRVELVRHEHEEPAVAPDKRGPRLFDDIGQLGAVAPPPGGELPSPPPAIPAPPAERPSRLSFTALSLYDACPYRYYAERILGLRPLVREAEERELDARGEETPLAAVEVGSLVHALLERDIHEPDAIAVELARLAPTASTADRARIVELVRAWAESHLAERLRAVPTAAEVDFMLALGGSTIVGKLDLVAAHGDGVREIVDYKTNRLDERDPASIRDQQYALQEAVYALASLRAGAPRVDVHFAFLDGGAVVSRSYGQDDAERLAVRVADAVAAATSDDYPPRPGPICQSCAAYRVLCAGPDHDDAEARA